MGDVRRALGESADVVFDCVSVQQTVSQAIAIALKGGTVVVLGVPAAEVTIPLPHVQDHQVRIQGSATYVSEDFATAIDLLAHGGRARGGLHHWRLPPRPGGGRFRSIRSRRSTSK